VDMNSEPPSGKKLSLGMNRLTRLPGTEIKFDAVVIIAKAWKNVRKPCICIINFMYFRIMQYLCFVELIKLLNGI
jgi:hypothetical protein